MKKVTDNIKSFFGHLGIYFTVIVMALNFIISLVFPSGDAGITTSMFNWIFLFCIIFALCDFVMKINFIESYIAKIAIHFILVTIDFAVVIAWLSDRTRSAKSIVFATIIFAACFFIVDVVRVIVHSAKHKKTNEKQEYQSLFTNEQK